MISHIIEDYNNGVIPHSNNLHKKETGMDMATMCPFKYDIHDLPT